MTDHPGSFDILGEGPSTYRDYKRLKQEYETLCSRVPHGDGAPVLVLPGLLEGDKATATLRGFLADIGYVPHGWNMGMNKGLTQSVIEKTRDLAYRIYEQGDKRPLSLIGHSLGGVLARDLARQAPAEIARVITLGTPVQASTQNRSIVWHARAVYKALNFGNPYLNDKEFEARMARPVPVPATSIYTKGDTVVHWKACLTPFDPFAENIEVVTGHFGLIYNVEAYIAIADRLMVDPMNWHKFDPGAYPGFEFTPA